MKAGAALAVLAAAACGIAPAKADFLSQYLKDKTFGEKPGPCTLDSPCTGDVENLPPSVLDIEVCLLNNGACNKLGELVQRGDYTIWDLQCSKVSVDAVTIDHGSIVVDGGAKSMAVNAAVSGLREKCTFQIDLDRLFLRPLDGFFEITMSLKDAMFEFEQTADEEGSDLSVVANLNWLPPRDNIEEDIPSEIRIPVKDCDINPRLGLVANLEKDEFEYIKICIDLFITKWCVSNTNIIADTLIFKRLNWSRILSALGNVLQGLFGAITCQIIEEMAVLRPGTAEEEPGLLNILWAEVVDIVEEAATAQPDDLRLEDTDARLKVRFPYLNDEPKFNETFLFSNSTTMELVSVALNDWLGSPSREDPSKLVVNELIELITDPVGVLDSGDLIASDISTKVPANIADVTVRIDEIFVGGANSIEVFKVLQNGYDDDDGIFEPYRRTLTNRIVLKDVTFRLRMYVKLERGDWVTESCNFPASKPPTCTDDSYSFTFDFGLNVKDLDLTLAVNTVFNPSELDPLKVGQISSLVDRFEKDVLNAWYWFRHCASAPFYSLFSPSLEAKIGKIEDPVLLNFGGTSNQGLNDLLLDSVKLFAEAARGALRTKLPGALQGPGREALNEMTATRFVAVGREKGISDCPPWFPNLDDPSIITVDFKNGFASYLYSIINDAVGGNPIVNTNSDINELVDSILKFYEVKLPWLALDSWDNVTDPANPVRFPLGYWELKDDYQRSMKIPAYKKPGNWLHFTDFSVTNVNSIYRLTAAHSDEKVDGGLDFKFGLGGTLAAPGGALEAPTPLEFRFTFDIATDSTFSGPALDEKWYFVLTVSEMDFSFLMNEVMVDQTSLNNLYFSQSTHVPCLLQGLKRVLFPQDRRLSTLETLDFDVIQEAGGRAQGTGSRIVDALHGISGALLDPGSVDLSDPFIQKRLRTQRRFKGFINSLFFGVFNYGLDEIEDIPVYYEKVNSANCMQREDPLEGASEISFSLPNFTYFEVVCLADVNKTARLDVAPAEEFYVTGYASEVDDVYDWEQSTGIELLQQLVGSGDSAQVGQKSTLNRILFGLANSTDNLLSEYFVLGTNPLNGEPQVNLQLPLSILGFLLEDDRIIPGLVLDAGTMFVEGIERLVEKAYDIFNPVGTMTLRHSFRFDDETPLNVRIESLWEMDLAAVNETGPGVVRELITTELGLSGLEVALDTIIAIDENKFGNLTLGHLLRVDESQNITLSDDAITCVISTLFEGGFAIPYLDVSITNMTGPSVTTKSNELLSPAVVELLGATVELLKEFYIEAIPSICDNCLRTFFNDYMRDLWTEAQVPGACPAVADLPAVPLEGDDVFYRFNQAPDWLFVQEFFTEYLFPDDFKVLNAVIGAATDKLFLSSLAKEQIRFEDVLLVYDGVTYGSGSIQVADVRLRGFNTFDYLRFFEPYQRTDVEQAEDEDRRRLPGINATANPSLDRTEIPYMTLTQFRIEGEVEIDGQYDLNATDLFISKPDMKNQLRVNLKASSIEVGMQIMMKVNLADAMGVRFSSVSEFNELPCLFAPVAELEIQKFNLSTSEIKVEIECLGTCDLFEGYGLEKGSSLNSENGAEIGGLFNGLVSWFTAYIDSQGAQGAIDVFLGTSKSQCAKILGILEETLQQPSSSLEDIASLFGLIFVGIVGVGSVGMWALFPAHKQRRKTTMARALAKYKQITDEGEIGGLLAMVELRMKSLFQHPMTPNAAKYIIPVVCILNVIGLVVAIVFSDAANIVIQFTVLGQVTQQITLVPFTIVSTINDMWNSGAWPLAVLIAVASCAWPVVKNLMLLGFWFCPSTLIRPHTRRWWLELLDMLGKWSFLDVYVIVIMLAALRTYVKASYLSYVQFLPSNFFVADVNVTPESGIILLCFVASTSLIINHIIIVMHDRVEESNNVSEDKIAGNHFEGKIPARAVVKRSIMTHTFIGKDSKGHVRRVSKKGAVAILALVGASGLLILVGITLPLITFELDGLVGLLLELFEDNANANEPIEGQLSTKTYSVFSLGSTLGDAPATNAGDRLVIIFFQLLYFICVVGGPFATIGLLIALFVMPQSLPNLKQFLFWAKIASYWSAIEVLVVGLVATIIEIQPVTAFIVDFITNDICGFVKAAIATIVRDADTDGYCLNVVGSFEPTAYVLIVGVVMQLAAFYIVTVIARAVIDDRYFAAYHHLRNDVRPKRLGRIAKFTVRMFTYTFEAPNEGVEGVSSFFNLDNENAEDYAAIEETACSKLSDWCCSTAQGEAAADERIEAWQKRFGLMEADVRSSNPVFAGAPESIVSGSPSFPPPSSTSARVRSSSTDSVEV